MNPYSYHPLSFKPRISLPKLERFLRECKCGCGEMIWSHDKYGRERSFKVFCFLESDSESNEQQESNNNTNLRKFPKSELEEEQQQELEPEAISTTDVEPEEEGYESEDAEPQEETYI